MVQGLRFRFQALGAYGSVRASDSELKVFVFTGSSLPTSCLICCDIGRDEKGAGRVLVVQIPFLREELYSLSTGGYTLKVLQPGS